ncbi:MAG: hypothetical protein ACLP4V_08485, partial [Methylocella sp.]
VAPRSKKPRRNLARPKQMHKRLRSPSAKNGAPEKNSKTFKEGLKALTKLWEDARAEREDAD